MIALTGKIFPSPSKMRGHRTYPRAERFCPVEHTMGRRDVIAIGGSLGAVAALKHLLGKLPGDFAAAVFVVIHVGARGKDLLAEIFNMTFAVA